MPSPDDQSWMSLGHSRQAEGLAYFCRRIIAIATIDVTAIQK